MKGEIFPQTQTVSVFIVSQVITISFSMKVYIFFLLEGISLFCSFPHKYSSG